LLFLLRTRNDSGIYLLFKTEISKSCHMLGIVGSKVLGCKKNVFLYF